MNVLTADVLVVGADAAGICAALAADRRGAHVIVLDKSAIGVGGATAMAQVTVAAALGHQEPDSPDIHYADTVSAGRGLVDPHLAELLCEGAPRQLFETAALRVNWAADGDRFRQVATPGHSRRRCCYLDVFETGTGLVRGLKAELCRRRVPRYPDMLVTDLIANASGQVVGATALDVVVGEPVRIWCKCVVLACGGLTEIYDRSSAPVTMTGDAYALGARVGAELLDPELVQFFPTASLAPRTIGLDPVMWDPFRHELGGRLLNGAGEEFVDRYAGIADGGGHTATRDVVSYAILKEVEAGRGSPAGGAWLDLRRVDPREIRSAFPAAADRLLAQGIDLGERAVEVAPTAHYTLGGLRVDREMRTNVAGLLAAGEAVGGAHGANRLSGNAVAEALVFGSRAGASAAAETATPDVDAVATRRMAAAERLIAGVPGRGRGSGASLPALRRRLQTTMWELAGPVRDEPRLRAAGAVLDELEADWSAADVPPGRAVNLECVEWFEMRNMLCSARAVQTAALCRRESRGAHRREDFPGIDESAPPRHSVLVLRAGEFEHRWQEPLSRDETVPLSRDETVPLWN